MTGFSLNAQEAILDDGTVGLGRTLYLRLFIGILGEELDEQGNLVGSMVEASASGYTRKTIAGTTNPSTDVWTSSAGAAAQPSEKKVPKAGGAAISWTAGTNWGDDTHGICAWALTTGNAAWDDGSTPATVIQSGPIVDASSDQPTVVIMNSGATFEFTETYPLIVRLGDPMKVDTPPVAGNYRTVPI